MKYRYYYYYYYYYYIDLILWEIFSHATSKVPMICKCVCNSHLWDISVHIVEMWVQLSNYMLSLTNLKLSHVIMQLN